MYLTQQLVRRLAAGLLFITQMFRCKVNYLPEYSINGSQITCSCVTRSDWFSSSRPVNSRPDRGSVDKTLCLSATTRQIQTIVQPLVTAHTGRAGQINYNRSVFTDHHISSQVTHSLSQSVSQLDSVGLSASRSSTSSHQQLELCPTSHLIDLNRPIRHDDMCYND